MDGYYQINFFTSFQIYLLLLIIMFYLTENTYLFIILKIKGIIKRIQKKINKKKKKK